MSNNLPDLANLPAQELREHKMKVLLLEPEAMAKQRLMDYAANLPTGDDDDVVTYDELISRATEFQATGEYWSEGGRFESEYPYEQFWDDFELVTKIPAPERYGFFSCSC